MLVMGLSLFMLKLAIDFKNVIGFMMHFLLIDKKASVYL